MSQTYFVHDNGGRPFKVDINNLTVSIFKEKSSSDGYSEETLMTINAKKIFVGTSPLNSMTNYSGGFGKKFDGNSILLHLDGNNYVYIGQEIYRFKSFGEIITYFSPVGNSDVPYPYAIDVEDNYYLMIEDVVIMRTPKTASQMVGYSDPYDYYYHYQNIDKHSDFVKEFYVGKESSMMNYQPDPNRFYDWLISCNSDESDSESTDESNSRPTDKSGNNKLYIVDSNNKKIELTKETYIDLIQRYGNLQSFRPICDKIILQERMW